MCEVGVGRGIPLAEERVKTPNPTSTPDAIPSPSRGSAENVGKVTLHAGAPLSASGGPRETLGEPKWRAARKRRFAWERSERSQTRTVTQSGRVPRKTRTRPPTRARGRGGAAGRRGLHTAGSAYPCELTHASFVKAKVFPGLASIRGHGQRRRSPVVGADCRKRGIPGPLSGTPGAGGAPHGTASRTHTLAHSATEQPSRRARGAALIPPVGAAPSH